MSFKNRKGFTLLELIVVLLILGVLAAVAVPTFNTVRLNSAVRSVTTTAEAVVRGANAISASDSGAGGVTTAGHIVTSVGEAGLADDFTAPTLTIETGGFTCTVGLEDISGRAVLTDGDGEVVEEATCS